MTISRSGPDLDPQGISHLQVLRDGHDPASRLHMRCTLGMEEEEERGVGEGERKISVNDQLGQLGQRTSCNAMGNLPQPSPPCT